MFKGECHKKREIACPDCQAKLTLQVCSSAAGYYLGFFCDEDGPVSRESGYFKTQEEAEKALNQPMEVWERG